MLTKIAAVIVLVLAAINFAGWMAGLEPEPGPDRPAIVADGVKQ